jgi:hypothetical protein
MYHVWFYCINKKGRSRGKMLRYPANHHKIWKKVLLTGKEHRPRIDTDCLKRQADCCHKNVVFSSIFTRVLKIAKSAISFVMSVRLSAWNNKVSTGLSFMKFYIWVFC